LRVVGEEFVARRDVVSEGFVWICGSIELLNDEQVPLEKSVSFVSGQKIAVACFAPRDRQPLRHFARVPESDFVWVRELAQTEQRVETGEELADKKKIVVGRYAPNHTVLKPADNDEKVVDGERLFTFSGGASHALTARQCFRHDTGSSIFANLGKMVLELVAYPGEVRVHRLWLDMVTHVNREETQCFGRGLDGETVHFAKSYERIKCGSVCGSGGRVYGEPQRDRSLVVQTVNCPWLPLGLPGRCGQFDHFFAAPNATRGGL
jgi:hypothetical protein